MYLNSVQILQFEFAQSFTNWKWSNSWVIYAAYYNLWSAMSFLRLEKWSHITGAYSCKLSREGRPLSFGWESLTRMRQLEIGLGRFPSRFPILLLLIWKFFGLLSYILARLFCFVMCLAKAYWFLMRGFGRWVLKLRPFVRFDVCWRRRRRQGLGGDTWLCKLFVQILTWIA
mgnify:CR=1 FL=1